MSESNEDIKVREEAKRDRAYDPVQRWLHLQKTITWAEANLPPQQRRNRPRVLAASLIEKSASGEEIVSTPALPP